MKWKTSLDIYLTTPPNECYTDYFENITENLSNVFFDDNEKWVMESKQYEIWVEKCFNKGLQPICCAKIIERAFNKFRLK